MTKIYQFIIKNFTQFEVITAQPVMEEIENETTVDNFIIGMTNQHLKNTTSQVRL
jgi:hypothetical protein